MKTLLAAALVAGSLVTVGARPAEAANCRATSPTGSWGVGYGPSMYQARRLALYYCSINTPRGYTCYLNSCSY